MALENMDDRDIRAERIVKPSKSAELFRTILEDLLEDENPQIRDDANYVLSKLDDREVGIVCDDGIEVGDELEGEYIIITQVVLGDKFLPAFVVSPALNVSDICDHIPKPSFLDIKPSREYMRLPVIKAVSQMAFALRLAEQFGGNSNG